MSLPILMTSFFQKLAYSLRFSLETSRYALVAKTLRCKIAFSAIQKLPLSSLLKIKERLKSANVWRCLSFCLCHIILAFLLPLRGILHNSCRNADNVPAVFYSGCPVQYTAAGSYSNKCRSQYRIHQSDIL